MCSPSVSSTDFIESSYLGIFKGPAPSAWNDAFISAVILDKASRALVSGRPAPGALLGPPVRWA